VENANAPLHQKGFAVINGTPMSFLSTHRVFDINLFAPVGAGATSRSG